MQYEIFTQPKICRICKQELAYKCKDGFRHDGHSVGLSRDVYYHYKCFNKITPFK